MREEVRIVSSSSPSCPSRWKQTADRPGTRVHMRLLGLCWNCRHLARESSACDGWTLLQPGLEAARQQLDAAQTRPARCPDMAGVVRLMNEANHGFTLRNAGQRSRHREGNLLVWILPPSPPVRARDHCLGRLEN